MSKTSTSTRDLFRTALPPQLRSIAAEIVAASARAHGVASGLSAEEWARRPAPERWSVGEQIVHLNLASGAYLPRVQDAIGRARERGLVGEGPYRRDFLGWLLCRLTEPPVRLRVKTTAQFVPEYLPPATEALRTFDLLQEELTAALYQAVGLALDRIEIASPFDPRMHYNLISCFRILPAHQRHHLWLAEQTRAGLAGAGGLEAAS